MSAEINFEMRVDTTNCDREPIHIPGAILPHGAMLVLDPDSFEILQAAGDTPQLLGRPLAQLLGLSATTILNAKQIAHLGALASRFDLTKPRHLLDRYCASIPISRSTRACIAAAACWSSSSKPPTRRTGSPPTRSRGCKR